jgi:hypothetical protein
MIRKIEVTTETDSSDCETCGSNYDEGGTVLIDGKLAFSYTPVAACWGNANYSESDLILLALRAIGVEITVDGEQPYAFTRYQE